ncbi:unnamed protein product [Durusdinium trenchii]|uniref:Uncharacterized protein n=1 Tax=Durusdinium trenchii TaxID=1381693 RepID=A0ABP0NWC2_9DINO
MCQPPHQIMYGMDFSVLKTMSQQRFHVCSTWQSCSDSVYTVALQKQLSGNTLRTPFRSTSFSPDRRPLENHRSSQRIEEQFMLNPKNPWALHGRGRLRARISLGTSYCVVQSTNMHQLLPSLLQSFASRLLRRKHRISEG